MELEKFVQNMTHADLMKSFVRIRQELNAAFERNTQLNKENDNLKCLVIELENDGPKKHKIERMTIK